MKVALVHDYIKEYGGAERVLEALHETFPDAPVYTAVYLPEFLGPHKDRFKDWHIKTSWAQNIPRVEKLISPLRLLSPMLFSEFDFAKFDVVITSSTGASYFPNLLKKRNARLICYCHTPPRYLYGYATARDWKKHPVIGAMGEIANHIFRMVDLHASENVDEFIANSEEVAKRIKKFYRRDATIINPPVDVPNSKLQTPNSNKTYYLAGGRLARPKHIDLIVKTATEMKLPLKVFGKGFAGYGDELKKVAGDMVEFVGEVSDEGKYALMADARGFIFASEDEDFGITPIEAMGMGTPVIAYRSGGVLETVIEGKTGIFFDELTVSSLKKAIQSFTRRKWDPALCHEQAGHYSKQRFIKEIKAIVGESAKE